MRKFALILALARANMWEAPYVRFWRAYGKSTKDARLLKRWCCTLKKAGLPKDVSGELPRVYDSGTVEAGWFQWWEDNGFFQPQKEKGEPFSMVLPPPNITGDLHLGHALTIAIQDAIVRWQRMRGRQVVWVPGTDHAGIATQSVLERRNPGGTHLVAAAHAWREKKEANIVRQLKRLGASLDFTRQRFTMDEGMSNAVKAAFVRLFDEGLIYREEKMVNWCYSLRTAISDSEVKHVKAGPGTSLEVPGGTRVEMGYLEKVAFPLADGSGELEVCTTRLETLLGDTGVAVHPEDSRRHLIGHLVRHPLTGEFLPVVGDTLVDRTLGTGAVKVTPGHSEVDHRLAKRHNLPIVEFLDDSGKVVRGPPQLLGLTRWEARLAVRELLGELYRGRTAHTSVVPVCSRTGDPLDWRLRPQFFLRFSQLAQRALQAMESGELVLAPDYCRKAWIEFLSKPEDWCISRQLWWGHRIPAYRVLGSLEETWVSGESKEEAASKAAALLGVPREQVQLQQDEDVLDTWFSSALFPFSVFGWPQQVSRTAQSTYNNIYKTIKCDCYNQLS